MSFLSRLRTERKQTEVFKQFYTATQQKVSKQRDELQSHGWYTISEGSWVGKAVQRSDYRRSFTQVQINK